MEQVFLIFCSNRKQTHRCVTCWLAAGPPGFEAPAEDCAVRHHHDGHHVARGADGSWYVSPTEWGSFWGAVISAGPVVGVIPAEHLIKQNLNYFLFHFCMFCIFSISTIHLCQLVSYIEWSHISAVSKAYGKQSEKLSVMKLWSLCSSIVLDYNTSHGVHG